MAVESASAPTKSASSTSLGHTMAAALIKESSMPPGGTGAVFKTETQPAARAAFKASRFASAGTSIWQSTTAASLKISSEAATSSLVSFAFAPGTTTIEFV